MYKVSDAFTPIMGILSIYDEFGSVLDRDLIVKRTGKKLETNYTVINGDTGRGPKGKAWSDDEIFEKIKKAFIDMDIEDEEPQKRTRQRKQKLEKPINDILDAMPLSILRNIATELGEEVTRRNNIDSLIDMILLYEESDIREVIDELEGDIPF
jgi:hypothetical protein